MVPPYGVLGHRIVLSLSKSSSRQQPTDPLGLEPVAIPAGTKHPDSPRRKFLPIAFEILFLLSSFFIPSHRVLPLVTEKESVRTRSGSFRQRPLGLSVYSIELASRPVLPACSPDLQGPPGPLFCSPTLPALQTLRACRLCTTASQAKQKPQKDPPVSCLPAKPSCLVFFPSRISHRNHHPFSLTLFHLGGFCIATASFAILFSKTTTTSL